MARLKDKSQSEIINFLWVIVERVCVEEKKNICGIYIYNV